MNRRAAMATLDPLILVAFLALSAPGSVTGFAIHEWLGLAFVVLVALHLYLSWGWVPLMLRRLFVRAESDGRVRINALLNLTLFVMVTVVTVSGMVVSDYAATALGWPTSDDQRWRQLHNLTATFLVVVVGLHVALNWSWVRAAFRHYMTARFTSRIRQAGRP
jgi:hypothetical protein